MANLFPYGETGFASLGIVIFLPIAPNFALALHCQTIVKRYEDFENCEMPSDQIENIFKYRDGLRSRNAILVGPETVNCINNHQIAQSDRYVYSATNDFKFAESFLNENEEYRSGHSLVTMGRMGEVRARFQNMPPAPYLIIRGEHNHCLVKIEEGGGRRL